MTIRSFAPVQSLSNLPRKPYIRPVPQSAKKARAMTIAVGFECNEGFVLGADRLITHGRPNESGSFAHNELKVFKIESVDVSAVVCGSGDAVLLRPIAESFLGKIELNKVNAQIDVSVAKQILEETLNEFSAKINSIPDLSLLMAIATYEGSSLFLRSDGLVVYPASSTEVLGIGETSLVRYLIESVYRPDLSLTQVIALTTIVIYVAKKYCPQYCGGLTDIRVLPKQFDLFNSIEVDVRIVDAIEKSFIEKQAKSLLNLIDAIAIAP